MYYVYLFSYMIFYQRIMCIFSLYYFISKHYVYFVFISDFPPY